MNDWERIIIITNLLLYYGMVNMVRMACVFHLYCVVGFTIRTCICYFVPAIFCVMFCVLIILCVYTCTYVLSRCVLKLVLCALHVRCVCVCVLLMCSFYLV